MDESLNTTLVEAVQRQASLEEENAALRQELARQKKVVEAQQATRPLEAELQDLTSELFTEANEMVAGARRQAEELRRRNLRLEEQLQEHQSLLLSHQSQLNELKSVMAQREEASAATPNTSLQGTPLLVQKASFDSPSVLSAARASAQPPTSYSDLLRVVVRYDIPAYSEFVTLLDIPHWARSRPSTPTPTHSPIVSSQAFFTSPNMSSSPVVAVSLRETRFFKRVVVEDVEPALRLDQAPGLSWLARRTVMTSIIEGSLVIEQLTDSSSTLASTLCTLCGSSEQTHAYRTSDVATAHPVCGYCVGRLRSVCDFIGFLRAVKGGGWRSEVEADRQRAWEECTRLRERMFWQKMGGGVVPILPLPASRVPSATSVNHETGEGDVASRIS